MIDTANEVRTTCNLAETELTILACVGRISDSGILGLSNETEDSLIRTYVNTIGTLYPVIVLSLLVASFLPVGIVTQGESSIITRVDSLDIILPYTTFYEVVGDRSHTGPRTTELLIGSTLNRVDEST